MTQKGNVPVQQPAAPPPHIIAGLQNELDMLVARNRAGFQELALKGVQFDPYDLVNGRIDTLIQSVAEVLGPQGELWSIVARRRFEQLIADQIEEAGKQGRKAQLGQGASFTPEMIRQLARETGTFGSRR